jgi:hypothetical protein
MSEPRYGLHHFNTIPADDITSNGTDPNRDSWLPLNLADLPQKPPIQPTLGTINGIGLLYPGKRHIFSGPQESAKTLAAYLLAIQTIRDGGTVILLDFEMGAYDARARLTDLGATVEDLGGLLYAEPDDPATDDRIALLIGLSPSLVIVDAAAGAYNVQGLDDNKRADVEQLTNLYIRSFWKHGIATIMLDHVVKNTETRGAYAIGSERKVGGADVHLGFSVITPISRGHTGLYKITTHKDRGGYLKRGTLAEMELRSDPDTHEITCQLRPAEEHEPGCPPKSCSTSQKCSSAPPSPSAATTSASKSAANEPSPSPQSTTLYGSATSPRQPAQTERNYSNLPARLPFSTGKHSPTHQLFPVVPHLFPEQPTYDLFPLYVVQGTGNKSYRLRTAHLFPPKPTGSPTSSPSPATTHPATSTTRSPHEDTLRRHMLSLRRNLHMD